MTIRAYLRARRRLWLIGLAIFAVAMFGGLWQAAATSNEHFEAWRRMIAAIGALGLGVLLCAQFFLLRCPRCGRFMGPELRLGHLRPINFCPYCGVNLDEEMK